MTRFDKIVEALWRALRQPATTVEELTERVSTIMGESVSEAMVNTSIAHLRKNSAASMWTIPHVKRGVANENGDDDGRYIRVSVDRDGSIWFDDDADAARHTDNGTISGLRHIVTMGRKNISALQARIAHTRSIKMKAALKELIVDYE